MEVDVPVVGYGFRDALWAEPPHRELLDQVTGTAAAVMISGDLHSAWLNSAALSRYGHAEHPTGLLREDVAMRVLEELSTYPDEVADQWADHAARAAAARGVVGVVDLEKPWSLDAWTRRVAAGNRSLKVACGVWTERLDAAIERGLRSGDVVPGTDGLVRMGPFKVIIDGSLNTRTAYCHDPYPADSSGSQDAAHPNGQLLVPPEELVPLLTKAAGAGLSCAVHAIGDRANHLALRAFAESGAAGSIEHAQLLDVGDLSRFAELGVVASVQPEHALDDRDVADRLWAGRTDRAFPLRDLLAARAQLAMGSDAPVAPLDPWRSIAAAVHRSRDERPNWHPEQQITVEQALAASTAGPAGSPHSAVRVNDAADLVIVELDPYTAEPDQLRSMPVAGTLVNGRWTHRQRT
jgi:predicted amidohydrolase YtcJ